MRYYCSACKQTISPAEFEYSTKHFSKPLCRTCQKKTNLPQSSETKRAISSKPSQVKEEEIDVIAGAAKSLWKGVSKARTLVKESSIIREGDFNKWIADWGHARKGFNFSMESRHFFLGGADLDDFIKEIIKDAGKNILLANPYVEECYLTDDLIKASKRGIEIQFVLRPESDNWKRVKCQKELRENGILVHPDERIHSKIIVVDNKVAVVSSMNFYPGSIAGSSNEAGIVSIDEKVVESAANYIREFF